jgi:hypothetical protein
MSNSKLFYELGDLDVLRKLVFNFDLIETDFDENDKIKNKKSQKTILSTVLYNIENEKPVTYNYANGKKSGRVYSKGGIQFLKKEFRNAICEKYYFDIDINNAQPSCLLWWCENIGMNVPVLKDYCINRGKYYHLKQNIINVIYGGGQNDVIPVETDANFLALMKAEIKNIHLMMMNHKDYSKTIAQIKKKKENNVTGSLCSFILQDLENKCLQSALEFLETKMSIENFVLMFDGFMMPIENYSIEVVNEMNEHVFKQTGINAVFVKKEMESPFHIPHNWNYDEKELKKKETNNWYSREKIEFEKTVCRIEQPLMYLIQNKDNSVYMCNKNEITERFSYINFKNQDFTKLWFRDKEQRKYDKIDFLPPPKRCEPEIFNLWTGFEIEKTLDPETTVGIDTFKKVISIMADNNNEMETFIVNIIAHIIQKPAEQLPISLVLAGTEGTGKNIFGNVVKLFIGMKYCFETADLENEMFCRFKYNIMNKLLLIINEADSSQTFKYEQQLKNWIGNGKTQSFEGKGTKPIEMEIFFFILMITNNTINPVNITVTDRRYIITQPSNEYRCDSNFWGKVIGIFDDPENVKGVFNYFKNYNITVKNWSNERPISKLYNKIRTVCFDKIIKSLRTLIIEDWNYQEETVWLSNEQLYKLMDISKTDEQSFGSKLANKNIDGIEKQKFNNKVYRLSEFRISTILRSNK